MKRPTFIILAMLILTPLIYIILQKINNAIWSLKGLSIDRNSPEYVKRKTKLILMSIPIALIILFLI